MSKKELKRTKAKLKEKERLVPKKIKLKTKFHDELPLEGAREPIASKEYERKAKAGKIERREYRTDMVPVVGEPKKDLKPTNGVNVSVGLVSLIRQIDDLKVAKVIARVANRQLRKLKSLQEMELCRQFAPEDDVWWTKKGEVRTGRVVRVKATNLVVKTGPEGGGYVVLPVKKIKKGTVPREYLLPDTKRWAIGRVKGGGGERWAEAVV
jgi:hypothetical protein